MAIRPAREAEFETLTSLWEASVRASHHFLPEQVIQELRPQLLSDWLPAVNVNVYENAAGNLLGFSGVLQQKLEMLFILPEARGRGVGKALLEEAIASQNVYLVDVNEQNELAAGFYKHAGFEVMSRSPLDGQGRPYPLLHMRLFSHNPVE